MRNFVVLLGAPFVGKTALGSRVSAQWGYAFLDMGTAFRKRREEDPVFNSLISSYMDSRVMVPDHITIGFFSRLLEEAGDQVFISGFPRTEAQLKWFLEEHGDRNHIRIAYLEISRDESREISFLDAPDRAGRTDGGKFERGWEEWEQQTVPVVDFCQMAFQRAGRVSFSRLPWISPRPKIEVRVKALSDLLAVSI